MNSTWLKIAEDAILELYKFKEMLKAKEPVEAFHFLLSVSMARAILGTIKTLVTLDIQKSNLIRQAHRSVLLKIVRNTYFR